MFKKKTIPGQQQFVGNVPARNKMIQVNDNQGNPSANQGQGTTFIIYDSLPLANINTFEFFKTCQTRTFPLTNVDGTLQAGETVAIESVSLQFVEFKDPENDDFEIVSISPMQSSLQFQQGQLNFSIATGKVMQDLPLNTWVDIYNETTMIPSQSVFKFKNPLVIPAFLKFVAEVRVPANVQVENTYAKMTIYGQGGLFAAKARF